MAFGFLPVAAEAAGPGGWENVGGGLNDRVDALSTDVPGQLLVGGRFTDAGGNPAADRIASWNGSTWTALGPADSLPGAASAVHAIAAANGKVYAGGTFGDGEFGPKPDNLAVWNGSSWQPFCADLGGPVDALEIVGDVLFVGGAFDNVNTDPGADNLIQCSLSTGLFIDGTVDGDFELNGRVQALTHDALGALYAGGTFIDLDQIQNADYVGKYFGSWDALGSGPDGPPQAAIDTANVDALASDGTSVYVGTDDDDVGGDPLADHVARWTGSDWEGVGGPIAATGAYFPSGGLTAINELLATGGKLYATGSFQNAGGDPLSDHIAVFDGTDWNHLGSNADATNGPFVGTGNALAFFDGSVILGGSFTDAGGDALADRIAAYPTAGVEPPPPPPTSGPVVKLTKKPKKKVVTRGKRAKVKFGFESPAAVAFHCKLDKKEFAPCTSPKQLKVGLGKHTFQVAGLDAADAMGEAASFKFKVVRKAR